MTASWQWSKTASKQGLLLRVAKMLALAYPFDSCLISAFQCRPFASLFA
jgi:hypothetical protein